MDIYELLEAHIEGTLTDEQAAELERRVLSDSAVKRLYVEYMHQHAALRWHRGADAAALDATLEPAADARPLRRLRWLGYAAAAVLALVAGLWLGSGILSRDMHFATLLEVRGARWASTTLPTEPGSRLAAGRLRLDDGLATVRFDSGVELTIEGASDLELVRRDRCILHAGGLVANVPPAGVGFIVDTPKARVIDHGTSFGVSVDPNGEGRVQVFEGIVDVQHHGQPTTQRLSGKGAVRVGPSQLQAADADEEARVGPAGQAQLPAAHTMHLTTAQGRGRDAYIKNPRTITTHDSDVLLLVKQGTPTGMTRKAYMAFDTAALRGKTVREAHLQLTMLPTGFGFSASLPDCDFDVYGLIDEAGDNWDPAQLDWATAPGNVPDETAVVDPQRTRLLGTFRVPRGTQQGLFEISGPELAKFLSADTNGIVTFIVARRTAEVRAGSLVHGFASSRHPTAAPPTLRVATE